MKKSELKRLLEKWQPRLRLEDWNIAIRFATAKERKEAKEKDDEYHGIVRPSDVEKSAEVVLVNPLHNKDPKAPDVEVIVVHELLHLHMVPFRTKPGSLLEVAEENLVNALAALLVALDRHDEALLGRKLPKRASLPKKEETIVIEVEANSVPQG